MTEENEFDELGAHKKFAVNLFNKTWDLMGKTERTREEDDEMIHSAHASRYHWGEVVVAGTPNTGPTNLERGEWQISRMYTVLRMPDQALHHAMRCLDICKENDIADWDIAFAYEAVARAHTVGGNRTEMEKYLQLAKEAGKVIKGKGDRDYLLGELESIKK